MFPLLTTLIGLPVLGAIGVLMLSKDDDWARTLALGVGGLSCLLSFVMWGKFHASVATMQFVELYDWMPAFGLTFHLGVDGMTMPLVALTAFINFVILLMSWHLVKEKVSQYLAAFLVLQAMTIGVFCALNAVLFYLFWEGMLIPMYLCIGIWGGENKSYAAMKFFLYTFFGSALLLIAIIYLGHRANSFDIMDFIQCPLT